MLVEGDGQEGFIIALLGITVTFIESILDCTGKPGAVGIGKVMIIRNSGTF